MEALPEVVYTDFIFSSGERNIKSCMHWRIHRSEIEEISNTARNNTFIQRTWKYSTKLGYSSITDTPYHP